VQDLGLNSYFYSVWISYQVRAILDLVV
jgi:hypothetical protein